MKWGDYIARTAVRRVVYIIVGAIIAALMAWASPAHAIGVSGPGEAWTRCRAIYASEQANGWNPQWQCEYFGPGQGNGQVQGPAVTGGNEYYYVWTWPSAQNCPDGKPFDTSTGTCGNECNEKPNYGGAMVSGASEFCHEGCAYRADTSVQVCLGEGAGQTCFGGSWKPSGGTCSSGPKPMPYDANKDVCERKPGATHSQCVKPTGETCVTSAKGNRFCWKPGEDGDRMVADGSEGATKGQGNQQQQPPRSMTDPQHQGTSTTTVTTNNTTTVNATSIFSGSGSTGGQSNVGSGGKDSGIGGGSGSGSGDGDGDGEGDGPGGPGGQPGRFYEGNGKGISEAYGAFAARAQQAPLLAAAGNILGGCSGSGSCPVDTWDGGDYAGNHSLAEWCSGPLAGLLSYAGYILLAGMGAVAIRIGIL
ncbi:hypothetical protein [Luteimonas fraxinea]|uniref:hypothetical protein n=1 Tax=Luteimonas fraxinea TaxID=2901869 RepID=UPI001E602EA0|nr:hypothetical protein [Luteimonas fraxinea]MCD9125857.1 hypothetical protein [Luteimonas fraxinea]